MWEYKRIECRVVSYTSTQFMELLNNYAKEGWEVIHYFENEMCFIAVMKRLRS